MIEKVRLLMRRDDIGYMPNSWTIEEDTYIVWSFFMHPIAALGDYLSIPNGRPIGDLQTRFIEVMRDPSMQRRCLDYCGGDIVQFRRVKFSKYEEFQAVNAQRLLSTTNPNKILEIFAPCFHLTRSPSSIVAHCFLVQSRGASSFRAQLASYGKWKEGIAKAIVGADLVEIPTTTKDLESWLRQDGTVRKKTHRYFRVVDQMIAHAASKFRNKDYAAFRGVGNTFYMAREVVTIGRRTFHSQVDLDLSSYEFRHLSRLHAVVSLCADLCFYINCKGENMIVNGVVFMRGQYVRIVHGDVIDVGGYVFIFIENAAVMDGMRHGEGGLEAPEEASEGHQE